MGVPEEHAEYYGEGIRRGGVLVTVATSDERAEEAASILSRHHPIDLSRRAEEWRKEGWNRFDPNAEPLRTTRTTEANAAMRSGAMASSRTTTTAAQHDRDMQGRTATIPVVEEDIEVGKRPAERHVRVHTTVEEKPVEEQVRLREEHVTVERHPTDRPVSPADQEAFKERTIDVTETVEEPVVAKRARVVEEVEVRKEATEHVETVHDTVRRTDVRVEGEQAMHAPDVKAFDTYDAGFRRHFATTFAHQPGATYEIYMPAYRYGYTLATDRRYSNRDWAALSSDAQRDWERDHPGTWERFKAAIQHAWDAVRGRR